MTEEITAIIDLLYRSTWKQEVLEKGLRKEYTEFSNLNRNHPHIGGSGTNICLINELLHFMNWRACLPYETDEYVYDPTYHTYYRRTDGPYETDEYVYEPTYHTYYRRTDGKMLTYEEGKKHEEKNK